MECHKNKLVTFIQAHPIRPCSKFDEDRVNNVRQDAKNSKRRMSNQEKMAAFYLKQHYITPTTPAVL